MTRCELCTACFNGEYPTNLYKYEDDLKRHKGHKGDGSFCAPE